MNRVLIFLWVILAQTGLAGQDECLSAARQSKVNFKSDNRSRAHPRILQAVVAANQGPAEAYSGDSYSRQLESEFSRLFGRDLQVHLVATGTVANVLGIGAFVSRGEVVLCADSAHLNRDEGGAPEAQLGVKLLALEGQHGKITAQQLEDILPIGDGVHQSPARVVSISQPTEYGTLYSVEEIRAIVEVAHAHGLKVHVDGARIANALVSLRVSVKEMLADTGVDVVSFGGSKNGLMMGEAVVFLSPFEGFDLQLKRTGQLISKSRFLAVAYLEYFKEDLWLQLARKSNLRALELASVTGGVTIPVQSNAVFVVLPDATISRLQQDFDFYVWEKLGDGHSLVRLMTSWNTTYREASQFAAALRE